MKNTAHLAWDNVTLFWKNSKILPFFNYDASPYSFSLNFFDTGKISGPIFFSFFVNSNYFVSYAYFATFSLDLL